MKKNNKYLNYAILSLGLVLVFYASYIFITLGDVNFTEFILGFGLLLVFVSTIELLIKKSLLTFFPVWFQYIYKGFITLFLISFIYVEGNIIYYMSQPTLEQSDYTIVLGSGLLYDELTSTMMERLQKAIELYEQNQDMTFILSGGIGAYSSIPESSAMKAYLMNHGIPERQLLEEPNSANTLENLTYSNMDDTNKKMYTALSSDYHLYRIQLICNDLAMQCQTVGAPTNPILLPNFMIREYFALVKHLLIN